MERNEVVAAAFDQLGKSMSSLGDDADAKDRLAAVRAVTALVEAVEGKRTVVEHVYPLRAGADAPADIDLLGVEARRP